MYVLCILPLICILLLCKLDASINIGLMEYVTGGTASDADYGYVRYHIRPMTSTNKASFSTVA